MLKIIFLHKDMLFFNILNTNYIEVHSNSFAVRIFFKYKFHVFPQLIYGYNTCVIIIMKELENTCHTLICHLLNTFIINNY